MPRLGNLRILMAQLRRERYRLTISYSYCRCPYETDILRRIISWDDLYVSAKLRPRSHEPLLKKSYGKEKS